MEASALSHPEISFSLRNDNTSKIVLQTNKKESVLSVFTLLYGTEMARPLTDISITQDNFNFTGYISKEASVNKQLQFFFINRRPILKSKFHKVVNYIISKKSTICRPRPGPKPVVGYDYSPNESPPKQPDRFPVYVIHLECPLDEYDITFEPRKTLVEFKDWSKVLKLTKDLVYIFLRNCNLLAQEDKYMNKEEVIEMSDAVVKDALTEQSEIGTDINLGNYKAAITTDIVHAALRSKRVCHQSNVSEKGLSELEEETTSGEEDKIKTVSASSTECDSVPGQSLTSGNTDLDNIGKTFPQPGSSRRENNSPNFTTCPRLSVMLATQENEPVARTEVKEIPVVLKPKTALMQEPPTLTQMLESDGSQLSCIESSNKLDKDSGQMNQDVHSSITPPSSSVSSQGSLQSFREYFSSRGSLQSFRDYFKQKHTESSHVSSSCDDENAKSAKKDKQGASSALCLERLNKARFTLLNPPISRQKDKNSTQKKSPNSPYFVEVITEKRDTSSLLNRNDGEDNGNSTSLIERQQDRPQSTTLTDAHTHRPCQLQSHGPIISEEEAAKDNSDIQQKKSLPSTTIHKEGMNFLASKTCPLALNVNNEAENSRKRIFLSTESFVQTIHDVKKSKINVASKDNRDQDKQLLSFSSAKKNVEDSCHSKRVFGTPAEVPNVGGPQSNDKKSCTSGHLTTVKACNSFQDQSPKDFDGTQVRKDIKKTEFYPSVSSDLLIEFVPLDLRESGCQSHEKLSSKENEKIDMDVTTVANSIGTRGTQEFEISKGHGKLQGIGNESSTESNSIPAGATQEFEVNTESQGFHKENFIEPTQPFSVESNATSAETLEPSNSESTIDKCSKQPMDSPQNVKESDVMSIQPFISHDSATTDMIQQRDNDSNTPSSSVKSTGNCEAGSGWFYHRDPNTG